MKNRVLGLAVVAAALAAAGPIPGGVKVMPTLGVQSGPGAPAGGVLSGGAGSGYSLAGLFSGGGLRGNHYRPSYKKRGWSVAEDRRRARKRRNKLRAKGHHKAAVR